MSNGWKLYKRCGLNIKRDYGYFLKLSWMLYKKKAKLSSSKVVGVTFSNKDIGISRQVLLKHLSKYHPNQVRLCAIREVDNFHDKNAIRIDATVIGKGTSTIGYFGSNLAKKIAPQIDNSKTLSLFFGEIKQRYGCSNLGCIFYYIIA